MRSVKRLRHKMHPLLRSIKVYVTITAVFLYVSHGTIQQQVDVQAAVNIERMAHQVYQMGADTNTELARQHGT